MIAKRLVLLLISSYLHMTFQCALEGANVEDQDRFGNSVSIWGNTTVVGAPSADSDAKDINGDPSNNNLEDAGAVYTFIKTNNGWIQEGYLKPSNPGQGDAFGYSVVIEEDTIVVGAPYEDSAISGVSAVPAIDDDAVDSGAAYVFVRNSGVWSLEAYLKASNPDAGDGFGVSVSMSGNTIVVGAPGEASSVTGVESDDSAPQSGAAYVFVRDGTTWTQQGYLKSPAPKAEDVFGWSVGISGERIVVGAHLEDGIAENSGAAFIFVKNELNTWDHQTTLKSQDPKTDDQFGYSVSISGIKVAVGSMGYNQNAGAVNIFVWNDVIVTGWFHNDFITGPVGAFGLSVSLSDDVLLAGAPGESSGGSGWDNCDSGTVLIGSGSAYVYQSSGLADWSQVVCMKATTPKELGWFGVGVDLYEGTYVISQLLLASNSSGAFVYQSDNEEICLPPPTGPTGMGCEVTAFTGEEFVPRILSLSSSESCVLIESSTEVCLNCIDIRHPAESYFITTATPHTLPRGIYGCMRTSCAKRSAEDTSEDSHTLSSDTSRTSHTPPSKSKSAKTVASKSKNRPSKLSSKSPSSSDSSKSSSDSSKSSTDSSDSVPNLDSFDLVIYVGVDTQKQMFVEKPLTSTTQSTSNRTLVGVSVIGFGLLVLGVALFSYWMKRNDARKDEQSHLLTHNRYHSYI